MQERVNDLIVTVHPESNGPMTGFLLLQLRMMFQFSIASVVAVLFAIQGVSAACLLPSQLDGLCTSCSSPQFLISGFCVTPIPGCLTQISRTFCTSCSYGYTLSNNLCLPPSTSTSSSLDISQYLQTYADRGPNYEYQLLDFHFKGKYPTQLSDKLSNLSMVYDLSTTYGHVYALTYMNPYTNGGIIYRAEAIVDYFNVISEYRFTVIVESELTDYSALLWMLQREVIVASRPTLNQIVLNQIQQFSNNDYRLFYINFKGEIYVKDVQRTDNLSSAHFSFANLTQLYYGITENTVVNYVFSLFPKFQLHLGYTINSYLDFNANGVELQYYKFIFDSQIVVVVEVQGFDLNLFSYEEPDNIDDLGTGIPFGGFLPLADLQDTLYLEVYQHVLGSYQMLATKTVQSVRYQLVQGTNFMIEFSNYPFSHSVYVVIAFKSLDSSISPSVTNIFKNGVDISNTIVNGLTLPGAFNYQADATFTQLYSFFRLQVESEMSSLLPIVSVQYVVLGNSIIDYLVIFTPSEYTYLRYDPNSGSGSAYEITEYTVFGVDIPVTGLAVPVVAVDRDTVLNFLQITKPSLFSASSILIKYSAELDPSSDGYEMDMLTQFGVFFTRVHQKGFLYLSTITQVSFDTCADLDSSEAVANSVVASLNTFILQNYWQVSGYSLSLVQGFISSTGVVSYRMLYAKDSNRYEVQIVNQSGSYLINQLSYQSGVGCQPTQAILNGVCQKYCGQFVF